MWWVTQFYFKEERTVLILSRRESESICLGDDIVLTVVTVGKDKVRIGVKAPPGIRILRQELEVDLSVSTQPLAFPATPPAEAAEAPLAPACRRRVA